MSNVFTHLERQDVKRSLLIRHQVKQIIRNFLCAEGFIEFDTPILSPVVEEYTKQSFEVLQAEGIPKYFLPQSPQIYKQILMFSGYEKYFQFAHCFRKDSEINKSNHHAYEFMQVDLELRTDTINTLMALAETIICKICDELGVACQTPFPVIDGIDYQQNYETGKKSFESPKDKLSFVWVKRLPLVQNTEDLEKIKATATNIEVDGKHLIPSRHIFAKPTEFPKEKTFEALRHCTTESFDLISNGIEVCGGDLRITDRKMQEDIMQLFNIDPSNYKFYLDLFNSNIHNGGFAIGLDRITMILAGVEHINLTNAFSGTWWD